MPLSRHLPSFSPPLALALALAFALGGCIENMGDLKEALGVVEPVALAAIEPGYSPPRASIALANAPALVGAPVRLSGEASEDPQTLALVYAWDFGDGAFGEGATATHSYARPGAYLVTLVVTNAAGLSDDDTLALTVAALDRAPSVGIRAPTSGVTGAPVAFEALASDPEGAALTLEWDFGDGASSLDAAPSHAFDKPGVYDVRVAATDPAGNVARSSARVAIDGLWQFEGAFAPAGAEAEKIAFPVVAQARSIEIALAFEAGPAGLNDLEVIVVDAAGEEVARSDGGLGSAPERSITVGATKLAAGEWTVRVVKETGVAAEWTLAIRESLS